MCRCVPVHNNDEKKLLFFLVTNNRKKSVDNIMFCILMT